MCAAMEIAVFAVLAAIIVIFVIIVIIIIGQVSTGSTLACMIGIIIMGYASSLFSSTKTYKDNVNGINTINQ